MWLWSKAARAVGRAAYVDEDLLGWGFQNSINRLRPIGDFDAASSRST